MTKNTTRKRTASKAAPAVEPEVAAPMDGALTNDLNTVDSAPVSGRVCYAAETLIAEVTALYPEVKHTVGDRNGRGVALSVEFIETPPDLALLLTLIDDPAHNQDERVETVIVGSEANGNVKVWFYNNPVTQDDRSPFGLADAHAVLSGDSE